MLFLIATKNVLFFFRLLNAYILSLVIGQMMCVIFTTEHISWLF